MRYSAMRAAPHLHRQMASSEPISPSASLRSASVTGLPSTVTTTVPGALSSAKAGAAQRR
ncbi:MAG: hypothetical protein WDN31_20000 [Hyphomicrobium sp.]